MKQSGFRHDLQALRALAVTLVVVHHVWPASLHGGYIGVDVFFVISGFLITSHLVKELDRDGRIALGRFYARRARRLLPAALTVLLAGLLLVWAFLPFSRWEATSKEAMASAFYVENWILAGNAVDYSASQEDATVAQHYWSLSVEEQFYLFWPILIWGFAELAVRLSQRRSQRPASADSRLQPAPGSLRLKQNTIGLVAALALVTAVSLPLSQWWVDNARQAAYFVTPGRLWEFAVGSAAAMAARSGLLTRVRSLSGPPVQVLLTAAGWAGLLFSAFTYDSTTPFPGYSAVLPVVSTAAIILAGSGAALPPAIERIYALRPVQWLGDVSYSVYLWHWPLVVVAPFVVADEHRSLGKLAVVVLTLLLAAGTFRWIEPWGKSFRPAAPLKATFAAVAAGMLLIAGVGAAQTDAARSRTAAAEKAQAEKAADPCAGPRALVSGQGCSNVHDSVAYTEMGQANQYWRSDPGCRSSGRPITEKVQEYVCDFTAGDKSSETVYLVGDSHAQHWHPGIVEVAKRRHWKMYFTYIGGCPIAEVPYTGYTQPAEDGGAGCRESAHKVRDRILETKPQRVFHSTYARGEKVEVPAGSTAMEVWTRGLPVFWKQWADAGIEVNVLVDPPLNVPPRSATCLGQHAQTPRDCAIDRAEALAGDPAREALKGLKNPRIRMLDTAPAFCDDSQCFAAAGGVAVYYNKDHLNREYTRLMGPYLDSLVTPRIK